MPRILVVEHETTCPLERLGGWLADALPGLEWETRRPYLGDPIPEKAGADAVIVLGGSMGACDDARHPWLGPTRDLLGTCVEDGTPTLGVCLGAQLLAVACGGTVGAGAAGLEAGVVDVRWRSEAASDPLVAGLPNPFPAPSMHQDAVVTLPSEAVWLASSSRYPHHAFRVGECAWGLQFHPEVSVSLFRAWVTRRPVDVLARAGLDADELVAELIRREPELAAAGRALAGRFVAVVSAAARP